MKEIKDDLNRWRDIPCSQVGRINIVKITIKSNNLQIQCNPFQIPNGIFHKELEQKISKFIWKQKRPQIAKADLRKKNGAAESAFVISDYATKLQSSRQYGTSTRKKKYRPMEQEKAQRLNPCTYGNLIFYKAGKIIKQGKDRLFNKWCWENWTDAWKSMKLEHFLTPYTKINSKWIKDLNVRPETIKLLEETGRTLNDINQSKIIYDPPPRVTEIKTELEESTFLTSIYTTKLQSSRQYGTGTKNRNIDQWNKIKNPKINPCTYGYLSFDKGGKNIQGGKASSINGAGKTGQLHEKE